MKPIAWIGSNYDEVYLVWDKPHKDDDPNPVPVYHQEAVQSLQAERDRLREALAKIVEYEALGGDGYVLECDVLRNIARKALEGGAP